MNTKIRLFVFLFLNISLPYLLTASSHAKELAQPYINQSDFAGWKTIQNKIIGYELQIPPSWVEYRQSERGLSVSSCPPGDTNSAYISIAIRVFPAFNDDGLPTNFISDRVIMEEHAITTTTKVLGYNATNYLQENENNSIRRIYFPKAKDLYDFELNPGQNDRKKAYALLEKIISTFRFIRPEPAKAPDEYSLFKGIVNWKITYQGTVHAELLSCEDGFRGNSVIPYVFEISYGPSSQREYIKTSYNKIIAILNKNGWTKCCYKGNRYGPYQYEIFVKKTKIVGVITNYSTGAGDSLEVVMQY
jgi:hypothetical protein